MHYGSGSVVPSRSAGFTNTGSPRPARPGQLDQMMADNIAGGADPAEINEMCHASAAALLDRVHHTQDAELVERVLTLVDREGVDVIAELWSHADPDSLPGILWRLYLLRTWMRKNRESIARLWRVGEPVATTASAIAGVDQAPTEDDIARTADSILAGAFTPWHLSGPPPSPTWLRWDCVSKRANWLRWAVPARPDHLMFPTVPLRLLRPAATRRPLRSGRARRLRN